MRVTEAQKAQIIGLVHIYREFVSAMDASPADRLRQIRAAIAFVEAFSAVPRRRRPSEEKLARDVALVARKP